MSTILDALSKARAEDGAPPDATNARIQDELILRGDAALSDRPPVKDSSAAATGAATGVIIGISLAALFFVACVLTVSILLVKTASQNNQNKLAAGNPAVGVTPPSPAATATPAPRKTTPPPPAKTPPLTIAATSRPKPKMVSMTFNPPPKPTPAPAVTPTPAPRVSQHSHDLPPTEAINARPTPATPGQLTEEEITTIGTLKLTGIVFTKIRPKALVNNQVVSTGEMVGRVKVVEIQKNFIKVELNGKTHDLYIN